MKVGQPDLDLAGKAMPVNKFKHTVHDGIVHPEDQPILDKYVIHNAVSATSLRPKRGGIHNIKLTNNKLALGRWLGKRKLEQHDRKNLIKQTTSKGNVRYYELISETSDTPSFSDKIYDNLLQSTPEGIMRVADELAEHSDELEEIEEKLRHLSNTQSPNKIQLLISKVSRNPKIAQLIKERQNYICEICNREPFIQANGTPYAEADHIKPLGGDNRGLDSPENMRCLCSLCHAIITYGSAGEVANLLRGTRWN